MKIILCVISVTAIAVATLYGCQSPKDDMEEHSDFSWNPPANALYGNDGLKIRFNAKDEKDEVTLAKEKASEQWNRNLYMMDSYVSLEEYVEEYLKENEVNP